MSIMQHHRSLTRILDALLESTAQTFATQINIKTSIQTPTPPPPPRIAVAVSGGVDSSVTAWLYTQLAAKNTTKIQQPFAVYMHNWDDMEEKGQCTGEHDRHDAEKVAHHLGIEMHHVDFVRDYWINVFETMVHEYECARTPNPDVLCNRHIKFDRLVHWTQTKLQCAHMATGHYARIIDGTRLYCAVDTDKDQSYFLAHIKTDALRTCHFPLGQIRKSMVKRLAHHAGLPTAMRKESMGVCFIGKRDFTEFLRQYIPDKEGDMVDVHGNVLGKHRGLHLYTVGQRPRVGGLKAPLVVARKDVENNRLVLAKRDHALLWTKTMIVHSINWLNDAACAVLRNGVPFRCLVKTRSTGGKEPCSLMLLHSELCAESQVISTVIVHYEMPHCVTAPGQVVAFYANHPVDLPRIITDFQSFEGNEHIECLGAGIAEINVDDSSEM